MKALRDAGARLLDAYGALFLARRRLVGTLVLAATLCDPATGACGFIAGLAALAARTLLRLPALPGEADLLNAIYAGLALGAFYGIEPRVIALAAFGGMLAVPLGTGLRQVLAGPLGARGLPLLGAPFLVTAWTLLAAAHAFGLSLRWAWPAWPGWLPNTLAATLANVGALFYVAHPLAGMLVLAALLLASRALALLALGGGLLAHALVLLAGAAPLSGLTLLAAFNGALAALFVGGVLTQPSLRALLLAGAAVVAATGLSAGMLALAAPFGMPPLSAPFVLTVWIAHAALRPESSAWWARFWLPQPARPEDTLVAGRLGAARGLAAGSVALRPPFAGCMEVAQGVDGAQTHSGPWRYAFDFIATDGVRSYRMDGAACADFFAFDRPLLAPCWGTVAACRHDLADNAPGEMNLADNWGNHILIDIGGGLFVLLAHLRQGSLEVVAGQAVAPGAPLARCGNSGRSAQPHLHLHVQRGAWLGAPTVPCHLTHSIIDGGEYALDAVPTVGRMVAAVVPDAAFAAACAPLHGRHWRFADGAQEWSLTAETGLLGDTVLASCRGARIRAVAGHGLLALFRRDGARDPRLDAFALAFGLTPCTPQAACWRDAPDANLLPLPLRQRLALTLRHPFGANLDSRYERHWDAARGLWRQVGRHRIASIGGSIEAESIGWLSAALGPVAFSLAIDGRVLADAALAGYGNRGDHGVPAWSAACRITTTTCSA